MDIGADLLGMFAMRPPDHRDGLQRNERPDRCERDHRSGDDRPNAIPHHNVLWGCRAKGFATRQSERTSLDVAGQRIVVEVHHVDPYDTVVHEHLDLAPGDDRRVVVPGELIEERCLRPSNGVSRRRLVG